MLLFMRDQKPAMTSGVRLRSAYTDRDTVLRKSSIAHTQFML